MSETHTDDRHPFWQVQTVFDPDKTGKDFAYTIGLHDRGVPELHIWARPSLGSDPGDDWKFSIRDTGGLLNEFSWKWLEGRLSVGDTFERTYDNGLVTVRFRVDPPDDRDLLEAFGIAPDAAVVPIRWSLHRALPGELAEMEPTAVAEAAEEFDRLRAALPDLGRCPAGWEVPSVPDWSPEGRYGPRTPLVLARAALLWTCDETEIGDLIDVAMCVGSRVPLTWPLATVQAVARAHGRHVAMDRLMEDIKLLIEQLGDLVTADFVGDMAPENLDRGREYARGMITEILAIALTAELVGDLAPEAERLAGLGPLTVGRLPALNPCLAPWQADHHIRQAVDSIVGRLQPRDVLEISRRHLSTTDPGYWEVAQVLRGFSVATACRWTLGTESRDQTFIHRVAALHWNHPQRPPVMLNVWGTMVAAILSHRMHLTADEVARFAALYEDVVPGLEEVLNAPVAPVDDQPT